MKEGRVEALALSVSHGMRDLKERETQRIKLWEARPHTFICETC